MFNFLLDAINEYLECEQSRKWIGNERLAELEKEFNHLLNNYIDSRIKAANKKEP